MIRPNMVSLWPKKMIVEANSMVLGTVIDLRTSSIDDKLSEARQAIQE
jgi:hypothetical protein